MHSVHKIADDNFTCEVYKPTNEENDFTQLKVGNIYYLNFYTTQQEITFEIPNLYSSSKQMEDFDRGILEGIDDLDDQTTIRTPASIELEELGENNEELEIITMANDNTTNQSNDSDIYEVTQNSAEDISLSSDDNGTDDLSPVMDGGQPSVPVMKQMTELVVEMTVV